MTKKLDTMLFLIFCLFGIWFQMRISRGPWKYMTIEGHEGRKLIYKLRHVKLVFSLNFFSRRRTERFPSKKQ
jgi:hypothetical protein